MPLPEPIARLACAECRGKLDLRIRVPGRAVNGGKDHGHVICDGISAVSASRATCSPLARKPELRLPPVRAALNLRLGTRTYRLARRIWLVSALSFGAVVQCRRRQCTELGTTVPRYYLHVRQGETLCRDLEGEVFLDLEEARAEAICSARELAAAAVTNNELVRGHVDVKDVDGRILATVRLRDMINIEP